MQNPIPYKDFADSTLTCPSCRARHTVHDGDVPCIRFLGYLGFGMFANWAELSLPCSACGAEIRFEVNHAAEISIPRMLLCRGCRHYFDHGLTEAEVRTLVRSTQSRTIACPHCGTEGRFDFPGCLGANAVFYT